jgi:RNA recognition motif-containing protein
LDRKRHAGFEDSVSMKLYVGNLPYNTSEDDLRSLFSTYGAVSSVAIITDRDTGRSKGFGFVEFGNDDEARNAISALSGQEYGGRALTVNEARPKTQGGGGGRGRY